MIGYSPLDFSVLDPHWGNIDDWRNTIDAVHARGMYFMADFTVGTMGDLLGFDGLLSLYFLFLSQILILFICSFLNTSTPFSLNEYNTAWKNPSYIPWNFTEYRDFTVCVIITTFKFYTQESLAWRPTQFVMSDAHLLAGRWYNCTSSDERMLGL